jgi:hypothetical protein
MRYFDNLNTGGVPIDGVGDAITPANQTTPIPPGPPNWQLVTGPAGSLVTTRSLTTTLVGARVQTWYVDQAAPQPKPCTGDSASWGDSGLAILAPSGQTFVNTDPTLGVNPPTLSTTRFRYFGGPGFTPADAAAFAARAANPIAVSVSH